MAGHEFPENSTELQRGHKSRLTAWNFKADLSRMPSPRRQAAGEELSKLPKELDGTR